MSYYSEEFDKNPYGLNTIIKNYTLICTCSTCPEQYDVFDKDHKQVGYLRLRESRFSARAGLEGEKFGGEEVYVNGNVRGYGNFYNQGERTEELANAVVEIEKYWENKQTS